MTREKALEVMDALTAKGYPATIHAHPVPVQHLNPHADEGVMYYVSTSDLSYDSVDLRALVEIADALDLDVGTHKINTGDFTFSEKSTVPAVIRSPRQHPR